MGDKYQKPGPKGFGIIEASQQLVDKEQLFPCPYDPLHLVRAKRFQYHLMKCRKNYAGQDMVPCPFNARHVIPRPEQRHHFANCPDKALIEPDHEYHTVRKHNPDYQGNISVPKYLQDREVPNTSESWDDDIENDLGQYSYPPARNPSGSLSYQMAARSNGHERLHEEPPSLRQPRSQPASMGAPQYQQVPSGYNQSYPQVSEGAPQNLQPSADGQETGLPAAPTPTWSQIAGIGRGIPKRAGNFPVAGQSAPTGIGRGIVRPPPGFGRGQHGQRAGPLIAANIYNDVQ